MTARMMPEITGLDAAILQTVHALGGYARVGLSLKPDESAKGAARWLQNACDPRRREVLSPAHLSVIRRMGCERGVHTLAEYECRDAAYSPPVVVPVHPTQEVAQLQREYVVLVTRLQGLVERIEELTAADRIEASK